VPDLKFRERFEGMKSEKILTKIGFEFGPIRRLYCGPDPLEWQRGAVCGETAAKRGANTGLFKWSTGIQIIHHPFLAVIAPFLTVIFSQGSSAHGSAGYPQVRTPL
jgi:hypothetical protein